MYVPAHFDAKEPEALLASLAAKRMAVLVTMSEQAGLFATHLPMLWDGERRVLEGHIARGNPHWKQGATQALAILPGPEVYVSPSLYPSKAEHGKVVPTWNYEAVHVSGPVEWFDDAERLKGVVRHLTDRHEAGRAEPWAIDDAPEDYVRAMLRGIVGVSVKAERIEAKRKLSQNRSAEDLAGVVSGLSGAADPSAREVGALMRMLK